MISTSCGHAQLLTAACGLWSVVLYFFSLSLIMCSYPLLPQPSNIHISSRVNYSQFPKSLLCFHCLKYVSTFRFLFSCFHYCLFQKCFPFYSKSEQLDPQRVSANHFVLYALSVINCNFRATEGFLMPHSRFMRGVCKSISTYVGSREWMSGRKWWTYPRYPLVTAFTAQFLWRSSVGLSFLCYHKESLQFPRSNSR